MWQVKEEHAVLVVSGFDFLFGGLGAGSVFQFY